MHRLNKSIVIILSLIIIILIILIPCTLCSKANAAPDIIPGKIIVKLTEGSGLLSSPKSNSLANQLHSVLGEFTSNKLLSAQILYGLENRLSRFSFVNIPQPTVSNLARIYVLEFSSAIDPVLVARKLASAPAVEYAEPMPARYFADIPNDSLVAEQYYLNQIKAIEAWDEIDTADFVIVGVVDTGVDYMHEDLAGNIYENPGESGIDNNGNDMRSNGIDDDGNGFVDDWHGWDLVSGDSTGYDNDPMPGHEHGTHVAGTIGAVINNGIGIAGVAKSVKILPVKIGYDNPFSRSVSNTYEGILYAAIAGADVINCSWGGTSRSEAEAEIINAAIELGSVIVAAAGNNARELAFYPASYDGVMSVAAVDAADRKAWFSNYSSSVDVSAPGVDIVATIPGDEYKAMDGTSMASPVAAGVAALIKLKFPAYTPAQVIEHTKVTCDNIDTSNSAYHLGKIGYGRVNALSALTAVNPKSVVLKSYIINDANNDKVYEAGEKLEISLEIHNILSPVSDVTISASSSSAFPLEFISSGGSIEELATGEIISLPGAISFTVPEDAPLDYNLEIELRITDSSGLGNRAFIPVTIRPSYRTMAENNISVTFNSNGNIAYNDYPSNNQGSGFRYNNGTNLLYEGSLIIGMGHGRLSNVARGSVQSSQDKSFSADETFQITLPGEKAAMQGFAFYSDDADSLEAGVEVFQNVYQFDGANGRDFVIITYDIVNKSGKYTDSLFAGIYFDWDIGPGGADNYVYFDTDNGLGIAENVEIDSLPKIGVVMLSSHGLNFFALDNDGAGGVNPGVYDGYTPLEKWQTISSGLARTESSVTDASMIIAAGPISLGPGDTTRVAFSLMASNSINGLIRSGDESRQTATDFGIADGSFRPVVTANRLIQLYPNPVNSNSITAEFEIAGKTEVRFEISDYLGRFIIGNNIGLYYNPGKYTEQISINKLARGVYFFKMITTAGSHIIPFVKFE